MEIIAYPFFLALIGFYAVQYIAVWKSNSYED